MKWSQDVPTEIGLYWFYGWPWESQKSKDRLGKELVIFRVKHLGTTGKLMFVKDGEMIFHPESMEGVWSQISVPELPGD